MQSILIVGSANVDTVYRVDTMPRPGETIYAKDLIHNAGGKGANQATAAAKMGGDVRLLCRVGDDDGGRLLCASLSGNGVRTEDVLITPGTQTGNAMIYVSDDGENMIILDPGANMRLSPADVAAHGGLLDASGIVALQLEIPMDTAQAVIEAAKARGAFVVLNPSPAAALPEGLLSKVDLLIPNRREMEFLLGRPLDVGSGDMEAFIRDTGVGQIVVTLGGDGCCLATAHGHTLMPCERTVPVDTTGAGDTFLGTICAMLAEARPMEEAIAIAMRAAGLSTLRMGAQQSMPTRAEVLG